MGFSRASDPPCVLRRPQANTRPQGNGLHSGKRYRCQNLARAGPCWERAAASISSRISAPNTSRLLDPEARSSSRKSSCSLKFELSRCAFDASTVCVWAALLARPYRIIELCRASIRPERSRSMDDHSKGSERSNAAVAFDLMELGPDLDCCCSCCCCGSYDGFWLVGDMATGAHAAAVLSLSLSVCMPRHLRPYPADAAAALMAGCHCRSTARSSRWTDRPIIMVSIKPTYPTLTTHPNSQYKEGRAGRHIKQAQQQEGAPF